MAQVGFIVDMMQTQVCMINNWDTPEFAKQISAMSVSQKRNLYNSFRFEAPIKYCLIKTKPISTQLCNKIIHAGLEREGSTIGGGMPFLKLTNQEQETLNSQMEAGFQVCQKKYADDESKQNWVPEDIDINQATKALLTRAEQGDLAAQLAAIKLYEEGVEVAPDDKALRYWTERAAENGDVASQYAIGVIYLYGQLQATSNVITAEHWFLLAANQGDKYAQQELGFLYLSGKDDYSGKLDANPSKGIFWLEKSANQGNGIAAQMLGRVYQQGENGQPKNIDIAVKWYRLGAENHDKESQDALADILDARGDANSKAEAIKWYRMANNRYGLGRYFVWGTRPENTQKMQTIQQKYADLGDANALLAIAMQYLASEHKADHAKAQPYLIKAANAGDMVAQFNLGWQLDIGQFFPEDKQAAEKWLLKSAEQGYMQAQQQLAFLYINAPATSKENKHDNYQKALFWGNKAVAQGADDLAWRLARWDDTYTASNH